MQVILASASPRRLALLQQIGIEAKVCPADFDEVSGSAVQAEDVVLANAIGKCKAVVKIKGDSLPVIAADTVVVAEGVILGKPQDAEDAVKMLKQLSGKTHKVITGICVMCQETSYLARFAVKSDVEFRTFDESVAREYIRLVPVLDKAGAYAIQEHGDMIIANICGSYNNIVGLPTERLKEILNSAVNAD